MKRICITLILSLLMPIGIGNAKHRHHHHHDYNYYNNYQPESYPTYGYNLKLSRIAVASGHKITVASHLAPRWKALIDDFVAAGYRPRSIGCFTTSGHVPNSRHYAGAACDFDQRGWGLTVPFMYRAHKIIVKHGFRDGCDFSDCGHIDDGLPLHRHRHHRHHNHHQRNIYPQYYFPYN
jgi:hypothetical protein